jgi:hypothetical protein
MAKKSTKSSRRARANKESASKNKSMTTKSQVVEAAISDETAKSTVKTEKPIAAKKKSTRKPARDKPIEAAVEVEVEKVESESVEEMLIPTRTRMIVSAVALGVIVIALIFGMAIVRQQNADKSDQAKPGQTSGKADEILQSGGNVCTNGSSSTSSTASSSPDAVGMILQSNPASTIQTPQTMGGGGDLNTLQSAACF